MDRTVKTILFWVVICVSAMLLWQVVRSTPDDRKIPEIDYSHFMSDVEAGNVASVDIRGTRIQGQYRDGKGSFRLIGPSNPAVYLDALRSKSVEIRFRDGGNSSPPEQLLGTWAPLILLGALWLFMIRQMQKRRSIPPGGIPPAGGSSGFPVGPR